MRIALSLWEDNLEMVEKVYDNLSNGFYTHATPTMFNAGTKRQQMSSCFLLASEDSIDGIYKLLSDCAKISQNAGGIGMHIHDIRCKGSYIKGTGGVSNGIVPMLRVFNETARYVDQCFAKDTMVKTETGSKEISQLTINDKVLTSDKLLISINYKHGNRSFS